MMCKFPGQVALGCVTDEAEKQQQPETESTSDTLSRSISQGSHLTVLSPGSHGLQQLPPLQQHFCFGLFFFSFLGQESHKQSFTLKSLIPTCIAIHSRGK